MFVIDASVVVKWFIEEEHSDNARRLKEAHLEGSLSLLAPDLLIFETGNALLSSRLFSPKEIRSLLELLFSLELDLISFSSELACLTAEIASSKKITFYDASYIALAQSLKLRFITADNRLKQKLNLPFIYLLSHIPIPS